MSSYSSSDWSILIEANCCCKQSVSTFGQRSDSVIVSLLTTFEVSLIFPGNWGSNERWVKSKIKPTNRI